MSSTIQPPETPIQPPVYQIPPPSGGRPWYRQPRAWGVAVLIALLLAMTALFAVTLYSLGHAHGQVGKLQSQYAASQALNGKLQSQYAASQALNGKLQSQYATSQTRNGQLARDLAAQQGKALVGTWTSTSDGETYTWILNADHTETYSGPGGTYAGHWAIAKPGHLVDVLEGMGPAYPASEGGKNSDIGYDATFTMNGNTLTVTYAGGSVETYTRSSGTGV